MSPSLSRLAVASAVALLAVTTVHAQQSRSVRPATATAAPSASARAAQAAPNPAGLRPPIPAGLTSGSGAAVAGDPVAANNAVTRGNAAGIGLGSNNNGSGIGNGNNNGGFNNGLGNNGVANNGNDGNLGPNTAVMGAGAAGVMARGPSQSVPMGASGLNPVEVARNFINADSDRDGELTRSEASRMGFAAMSFEEMDRDFDGIITRAEYGDAMR
ncbi:MAG: hypothetical protein ACO1PB_02925 [Ramlibacter sp.]